MDSEKMLSTVLSLGIINPINIVNEIINWNRVGLSVSNISEIVSKYLHENIDRLKGSKANYWELYYAFGTINNFKKMMSVVELSEEDLKNLIFLLQKEMTKDYAKAIIKQRNFTKDVYIDQEIFEIMSPFYLYIRKEKDWYKDAEDIQLLEIINDLGDENKDKLKLIKEGREKELTSCKKFSKEEIRNNLDCFNWWEILSKGKPIDKDLEIELLNNGTLDLGSYSSRGALEFIDSRDIYHKPMSTELKIAVIRNYMTTSYSSLSQTEYVPYYQYNPWSLETSNIADSKPFIQFKKDNSNSDLLSKRAYWLEESDPCVRTQKVDELRDTTIINIKTGSVFKNLTGLEKADLKKTYLYPNVFPFYSIFMITKLLFDEETLNKDLKKELSKLKFEVGDRKIFVKLSNGKTHIINAWDIVSAEKATNQYKYETDKFYFFAVPKERTERGSKTCLLSNFGENPELYCIDLSK